MIQVCAMHALLCVAGQKSNWLSDMAVASIIAPMYANGWICLAILHVLIKMQDHTQAGTNVALHAFLLTWQGQQAEMS